MATCGTRSSLDMSICYNLIYLYILINNIIYVSRLTKNKKPLFLLKAFNAALKDLPEKVNLIIVGEGEEKTPAHVLNIFLHLSID